MLERVEPGAMPPNQTTWMLNIGTHVLPANEQENRILAQSLRNATDRVFQKPDFLSRLFYLTTGSTRRGTLTRFKDPIFRQATNLEIDREPVSTMVVENGRKTGKIDAHILMLVTHGEAHLELDHNGFAEMLQEELMAENARFQEEGLRSQRIGRETEILHWPRRSANGEKEARPYVSWRKIGGIARGPTLLYMMKQWENRPPRQEIEIFNDLKERLNQQNPQLSQAVR